MKRLGVLLAILAALVLAAAGTAWTQPPITYTESQKTTDGPYSDEEDGEVARSVNLTKSEIWDRAPV